MSRVLLSLLVWSAVACGQHTAVAPVTPEAPVALPAALADPVQALLVEHGVPGLSIAVARDGVVRFAQGFGLADVENDVPATPATVYRLASISKPITAVCVLQQVEAGALDLDRDVGEYLSEWPAKRWPVTARLLLAHLAGVRHYRPGEGESTTPYRSQRQGLERFAADPLLHEPGGRYLYSTFGFNLLAAMVEACSGQTFPRYVRDRIAGPAGAATLQDDDLARLIKHRAQGYVRVGEELRNSRLMDASYKLGGGGLCCNAPDLARFGAALLDLRLCSAESLAAMTTRQRTKDGAELTYGLGLSVADDRGEFWHTGAQSRVSTALVLRPGSRTVVAVLCNLEGVRLLPLARHLADDAAREVR